MKKSIGIALAGMLALAMIPFALASDDEINIKVFFIYPNGDIVEQTNIKTQSGFVDFANENLKVCNDLLYMIEEILPDYLNTRQQHMLDLAQNHIDLANTTENSDLELQKAIIILKQIYFELTGLEL